jgi:hypothetical protein
MKPGGGEANAPRPKQEFKEFLVFDGIVLRSKNPHWGPSGYFKYQFAE